MKKNIHPKIHPLTVTMTDGTQFETYSTSSAGNMRLEIDPKSHQAWTGVHRLDNTVGQLAKFNTRFKGFMK